MEAVREVIINRAILGRTSQSAVVLEPRQFSCWNGRRVSRAVAEAKASPAWPTALAIVDGPRTAHVGGATHYFAPGLVRRPAWATGTLYRFGRHAFLSP